MRELYYLLAVLGRLLSLQRKVSRIESNFLQSYIIISLTMSNPESTQKKTLEEIRSETIANFTQLESVIKAILFARLVLGEREAHNTIDANASELNKAKAWLPTMMDQANAGWMLRQRAGQFERKGEEVLIKKMNPLQVAKHVDAGSDTAELGIELSFAQYIATLTLGMLSKMKSVNYAQLKRENNLGGSKTAAAKPSFWMFNWQPEAVYSELQRLKNTAYWLTATPHDLARNHTEQFLSFGHFVTAMLIVTSYRADELRRTHNRKKVSDEVTRERNVILIPPGTKIKEYPTETIDSSNPIENPQSIILTDQDDDLDSSFSAFINGLNF